MDKLSTRLWGGIIFSLAMVGIAIGVVLHITGDPAGIGIGTVTGASLGGPGAALLYRSKDVPTLKVLWHGPGELPSNSRHDEGNLQQEETDY